MCNAYINRASHMNFKLAIFQQALTDRQILAELAVPGRMLSSLHSLQVLFVLCNLFCLGIDHIALVLH